MKVKLPKKCLGQGSKEQSQLTYYASGWDVCLKIYGRSGLRWPNVPSSLPQDARLIVIEIIDHDTFFHPSIFAYKYDY